MLPVLHLLTDVHVIYHIYQQGEINYVMAMSCVYALPGLLGTAVDT